MNRKRISRSVAVLVAVALIGVVAVLRTSALEGGEGTPGREPAARLSVLESELDELIIGFEASSATAFHREPRPEVASRVAESADPKSSQTYERNARDVAWLARRAPAALVFDILPRNKNLNPRDVSVNPSQLALLKRCNAHYRQQLIHVATLLDKAIGESVSALADSGLGQPIPESPPELAISRAEDIRAIATAMGLKNLEPRPIDIKRILEGVARATGKAPPAPPRIVPAGAMQEMPALPSGSVVVFRDGRRLAIDTQSVEPVRNIRDYQSSIVMEYLCLLAAFFTAQNALTIREAERLYNDGKNG